MIATNSNATDYLALRYTAEMVTVDADFQRGFEIHERAVYIHRCRMLQMLRLGLVAGKYWRDALIVAISGPQNRPRRFGFFAGFCDRSRGRHWDRKRG